MNKTFIISEIGINHNGDLDIAKKMIDKSVDAGADAVKFRKEILKSYIHSNNLKNLELVPLEQQKKSRKKA